MHNLISSAKRTLAIESKVIANLEHYIDASFTDTCKFILACSGRVIVTGIGKSGHIARKIASTFASTGTPAFFLHPSEASHGDLGMITKTDLVIAISYSGSTTELLAVLPLIKREAYKLVAVTGDSNSALAKAADVHLCVHVAQEACPLNLAPTSSTTATLVMGDALAIALLEARGFTREDFARSHPGGALGRNLLLKVEDIMHTGSRIPLVTSGTRLVESLLESSASHLGFVGIVNKHDILVGIFTDGDLRRIIDKQQNIYEATIDQVMTRKPVYADSDMLAVDVLNLMEHHAINAILVVDESKRPVGALNMLDLVRAKII